eukprot:GFUD01059962.1.p1 GENE.GFUD01059962.1~~GFUD01059962.1.p1  ORF type:complete len:135 (-),score=42.78 GFUD01059962.1:66-470(-)
MEEEFKKVAAECARHYNSGEFEKAEASYSELIEKYQQTKETTLALVYNNTVALVYNNRGHARYMQVEFYTAKDDFDVALTLNPKLGSAFYNRATILYRMGRFVDALADFQNSAKLEPANVEFQEGLKNCQLCIV